MDKPLKYRKEDRRSLNLQTIARIPHTDAKITVLDLSGTGCKIRTDCEVARIGTTVLLQLAENSEATGEIVWREGDECGVRFHRQIPEDTVRELSGSLF